MTFESFVVSAGSADAFSAAVAVAQGRADAPARLFLVGPTGAGKSHLLGAIEREMLRRRPEANVLRDTSHAISRRLTSALRNDSAWAIERSFAALDALLIDDFREPPATTEWFMGRIEKLSGVAVVVATDVLPPQLPAGAVVVRLGYPDERARVEIARREAARRRLMISEATLRQMAFRCSGNPRELQSAIARLAAEAAILRYAS